MPVTFSWTIQSPTPSAGEADVSEVPGALAGALAERDMALDPATGDLMLDGNGDLVFNRGVEAIASDLQSEFEMWLGEWYLDLLKGFPWSQEFLGQPLDRSLLRRRVEEHALLIPGVVSVQNYSVTEDGEVREISIDFEAVTDTGEIISATIEASEGSE